jgi:hypothetical protein
VRIHSRSFRRDIGRALSAASSRGSSIPFFSRFDSRSRSYRGVSPCSRAFDVSDTDFLFFRDAGDVRLRNCMFRAQRWWHRGKCGNLLQPESSSVCTYARTDPLHEPLQRTELSAKCHIRYDSSGCVRGSSIAVSMRSRGTTRGRPYKIHLHTGGAREMRENGGLEVCRIGVTCDHQGQLPQGAFADQTATPRKGYSLKLARSAGDRSM